MKERKETINLATANIVSLAILAVAAIVFLLPYYLIWGNEASSATTEESISALSWGSLIFAVLLVVGIVVHELIHGLFWARYAPSGFKSISFGVIWKMLTPYCHCNEPLKVKHYSIGALAPLVILGIIPAIAGVALHSLMTTIFGVIFIASAAGDIMVAWRLRKEPAENTVLDHPTEAGYLVYEPE